MRLSLDLEQGNNSFAMLSHIIGLAVKAVALLASFCGIILILK
jgi:hypothetical protein